MGQSTRGTRGGFTLVEIIIVVAIIAMLAAIAIPNVLRSRSNANESVTIGNLRTLANSLESYRTVNQYFPDAATGWQRAMYGADCNAGTAPDPDFGPPSFCVNMSNSPVQGYAYTYTPVAGSNPTTYSLTANPLTPGSTGTRAFFVNESGVIRHCLGSSGATIASRVIDQPPNASCP